MKHPQRTARPILTFLWIVAVLALAPLSILAAIAVFPPDMRYHGYWAFACPGLLALYAPLLRDWRSRSQQRRSTTGSSPSPAA